MTDKRSKAFAIVWRGPFHDFFEFGWVWEDTIFRYNSTELLHTFGEKVAFGCLALEVSFNEHLLIRKENPDQMF